MEDAAQNGRPSKRDVIVIDDEESTSEQPVAKSVKIEEEPVPSPEVVELKQKVPEWEDKFKRACVAARTAELRAEAAESRLDSKYGVKDEFHAEKKRADDLENRLAALTRLEEANKRAQEAVNLELAMENQTLKAEVEDLRKEHQKVTDDLESRNEELKTQMADMKKEHEKITVELEEKNEELKTEIEKLRVEHQKKADDLESRNEELKTEIDEMKKEHQKSSEEMELKKEELKTEIEDLRTEYQKRSDELELRNEELKMELDGLRKEYQESREEIESKNEERKKEMDEMRKEYQEKSDVFESRLNEASMQLDEERREVSELTNQIVDLKRNDCELQKRNNELTLKLGQYDSAMQPLLQLHLQQSNQLSVAMHHYGGAAAANVATSDELVKFRKTDHPVADSDLSVKLLDLVKQALECNQLKRGPKKTEKTLNLGTAEMVILAADIDHSQIHRDLPVLCETKNVPYVFVKSAAELTQASGGKKRCAVVSIIRHDDSEIDAPIRESKMEVEKLHTSRD